MTQKYDPSIRLTSAGTPDVDYYIREAKRLRMETFAAMLHDFSDWLRRTVGRVQGAPMRTIH